MKIIRDEENFGIMMIPLFVDWNVKRCNIEGCTEKPNTIIQDHTPDVPLYGVCEEHYQEGKKPGVITYTLVFDDFDAFEASSQH